MDLEEFKKNIDLLKNLNQGTPASKTQTDPLGEQKNSPLQNHSIDEAFVELLDFAQQHNTTPQLVWQDLQAGKLLGIYSGGSYWVADPLENPESCQRLPRLLSQHIRPSKATSATQLTQTSTGSQDHQQGSWGLSPHNPEFALMIDHLSLAREESREVLRTAQLSINKLSEMAQDLAQSKDILLTAQQQRLDEQTSTLDQQRSTIHQLQKQSETQQQELHRLKKAIEDLEALNSALGQ